MVPKHKSSDASNSDIPKKLQSENFKVLHLIRKEKNYYIDITNVMIRMNLYL